MVSCNIDQLNMGRILFILFKKIIFLARCEYVKFLILFIYFYLACRVPALNPIMQV